MTFLESTVHCHTNLCDGNNTPAEMAKAAFESGIKVLGLSGHSHTPHDDSYCMSVENTARYRAEIKALQEKYAGRMTILEQDAGLHFLLRVDTPRSDRELKELCARAGIRVRCLGDYFAGETPPWAEKCLIINYSGLDEEKLPAALERLGKLVTES